MRSSGAVCASAPMPLAAGLASECAVSTAVEGVRLAEWWPPAHRFIRQRPVRRPTCRQVCRALVPALPGRFREDVCQKLSKNARVRVRAGSVGRKLLHCPAERTQKHAFAARNCPVVPQVRCRNTHSSCFWQQLTKRGGLIRCPCSFGLLFACSSGGRGSPPGVRGFACACRGRVVYLVGRGRRRPFRAGAIALSPRALA